MTVLLIAFKSLRQHALSTAVTAFSIALAGGLLISVWAIKDQAQAAFTGVNAGFDAVLGARGSKLQLVLNSIFHVDESPGNISWQDYLDVRGKPGVGVAIPIAVGDNYRGYRLVGTTTNLFSDVELAPGERFDVEEGGRIFDPLRREAVVGSFAARQLNLKPGDTFHPYHGLLFDETKQHAETYVVVGILEPTNTPADRVIWISLQGIQLMAGHDPKAATDISSVLIKLKEGSAIAGQRLSLLYNKQGDRLTLAWPVGLIMAQLFDKIAWFERVLGLIAYLVAVVAVASVLASIYNSMNERRREIAILRALGARRWHILTAVVIEAAAIAAVGMIIAFVCYGAILSVAAAVIRNETGVILEPMAFHPVMIWAPVLMVGLSAVAGLVPAMKAYWTPVAENLAPIS